MGLKNMLNGKPGPSDHDRAFIAIKPFILADIVRTAVLPPLETDPDA